MRRAVWSAALLSFASVSSARAEELSATAKLGIAEAQLEAQKARSEAIQEIADVKIEAAREAARKAQEQLNDARSGKLIKYGITAGAALVAQTRSPTGGTDDAAQRSFNITTMPFLALVPAYWFYPDQRTTYCASRYVDTDQAAAASAAFRRAKERAKVGLPRDVRKNLESSDPVIKEEAEAALEKITREQYWDPQKDASCGWARIGVYIGKPSDYDAVVLPQKDGRELKREVKPTASIGIAFLPNAYITVMAGVTGASITEPAVAGSGDDPGQPETTRRFTTFTFGVGGNLDLLGAAFK